MKPDENLRSFFSNYGQKSVDVFAPGSYIYSTAPGNKYIYLSGTSMATPVVAGVAALVWSYYPNLTALQLKDILLKSSDKEFRNNKVLFPGSKTKMIKFKKLSLTGGIVNAYDALKLAEKTSKK